MNTLSDERHLIVKSTIGAGLGDRIRAVLSAILYAQISKRNLHIMWDDGLYGPEGENIFPRLFELRGTSRKSINADNVYSTRPAIWRGQLRQPMKHLYRKYGPEQWNRQQTIEQFSFDQSRIDYEEDVLVMWEFDQFGRCCNPRPTWNDRDFIHHLVKDHLVPAENIRHIVNRYQKEQFKARMIGIHIRRSDEPGCCVKLVDESQYHSLIKKILRQNPEAGIFLATDNADIERRFRNRYGDMVVTSEKWFSPAGEPLHRAGGRPDRLENAVEALVDMFLLAACDYLVYPENSSFSMAASYFSTAAARNIFPLRHNQPLRRPFTVFKRWLPSRTR